MHVTVNHVATFQSILLAWSLIQLQQAQTHFPQSLYVTATALPERQRKWRNPENQGVGSLSCGYLVASLKLNLFAEESQNYPEMVTSDYFHFNLFVPFEATAYM